MSNSLGCIHKHRNQVLCFQTEASISDEQNWTYPLVFWCLDLLWRASCRAVCFLVVEGSDNMVVRSKEVSLAVVSLLIASCAKVCLYLWACYTVKKYRAQRSHDTVLSTNHPTCVMYSSSSLSGASLMRYPQCKILPMLLVPILQCRFSSQRIHECCHKHGFVSQSLWCSFFQSCPQRKQDQDELSVPNMHTASVQ